MRKVILVAGMLLMAVATAVSQDWGPMQEVILPPPPGSLGCLNPSYCDAESLLYLDGFMRDLHGATGIYTSRLDTIIPGYHYYWSDPQPLPPPINMPGCINVMANINRTNDTLFFSSNRSGSVGGMDIWMSVKENGVWQEPVNLGDSINTIYDELKPYYASQSKVLFFERMNLNPPWLDPALYKSAYVNRQWRSAERLPDIINVPGALTVGPFFDEQEGALYFTNLIYGSPQINRIKKSRLINGQWQQPEALTDNINGFWLWPNVCSTVTTENIFLSFDRHFAFYDKELWEPDGCTDFWYQIFLSERQLGIRNTQDESPGWAHSPGLFEVFPNPSNEAFAIRLQDAPIIGGISIYNIRGQLVRELKPRGPGEVITWDATDMHGNPVASGVYLMRARTENTAQTKKILL